MMFAQTSHAIVVALFAISAFIVDVGTTTALKVGDSVCVEGYLMDQKCIDLGFLVDHPKVATLTPGAPEIHNVFCIVDVPNCNASEFTILNDPKKPGLNYTVGYRFDAAGKSKMLSLMYKYGVCSKCNGTVVHGFHVGVNATVTNVTRPDKVPVIKVRNANYLKPGNHWCPVPKKPTAPAPTKPTAKPPTKPTAKPPTYT